MQSEASVFTILEAAKFLRVGRSTIYNLIRSGDLPIRKLGHRSLILRDDLVRLLEHLPKSTDKHE